MLTFRVFAPALLPMALAGCYTSMTPLIGATDAVFPYQTIVYAESDNPAAVTTLTRQGDVYLTKDDKGEVEQFRFMPVSGNFYVAQVGMKTDHGDGYLYGLIKLDTVAKTVSTYATVADKTDFGPGLPACAGSDDTVCLTDVRPYIDHAMAIAGSNAQPTTVYTLVMAQ